MLTCYAAACLDAGNRDEALGHASDSLRVLEEAQASGGPPAIALVELLVRLLEDGAAFEPERVQKAAARWLPPQHALWPRLRAATDAAPATRE
jgi:hypothetical protein